MTSKKFTKNKENFTCEHCGVAVVGNGYTNHCPGCLWSKHVDLFPGDRLRECQALMMPVIVENIKGKFRVTHECTKCKIRKVNNLLANDSMDVALAIVQERGKKFSM